MIQTFIDYIEQRIELTDEDKIFLNKTLKKKTYKKGSYLLREGDVSDTFFFNVNGFVRLYYNNDGIEHTAYFYTEDQFISAYESYLHMKPATQNFQAIEDTDVVAIDREAAQALLAYSPKFITLAMTALEEELITCQQVIANLLTRTPEQRYAYMLEEHEDYFKRIPQHYIASFIGIKPESLSRIKKRYLEQKKS